MRRHLSRSHGQVACSAALFFLCSTTLASADAAWEGPYVGLSFGQAWGDSEQVNALGPRTGNYDLSGMFYGLAFGHDWQLGGLVMGLMGDLRSADIDGTTFNTCVDKCFTELNWSAQIRARVGYPLGDFMPYVSYGVAISEVSAGVREANSVPAPLRETDVNAGAVYGIGIDMRIGRGWLARLDHTVTDLGDVTYHIPSQNSAGFVDGAVHETSLALLYRFGAADGAHGTGSRASEGWAGPYAGLSLGWQNGDSRQDNSLPATTGDYDLEGEAIGLFAGYNWQIDRAVIGAEFGLSASNLSGETTTLCPIVCFTDISQAASIRANAGIDLGRWMPYATAGVRALTTDVGTRSGGFGAEDINVGAFAGAGVAYSLTDAVFLRGEVLHGDGGETTYFITGGEVGTVPAERLTEVSVGIGIRF